MQSAGPSRQKALPPSWRMVAGWPRGALHPNFKEGRYTRETRELVKHFRELARTGEALAATVMHKHGLKPPRAIRRRRHVKRALAEAKAKETVK
jgi:hypothetical protein